ncbi:ATP-binding protein [uncultured Microscilla sp.]|uniref:PAS domain-containing sensor histidine kinase n=1 Tax=uncultured Microscilla sp. TaxID=432653 RepID=UPI002606C760|nr:ATP-binding protein [uncultured Microscilla sp.]
MNKQYNPLLEKQLKDFLKGKAMPKGLEKLFASISDSYDNFEKERTAIKHEMQRNSKELTEANQQIKLEAERYKAAEALARKNEQILRSINEHINEAIFRSTPHKGVVYINQAFAELFAYKQAKEVISLPISALFVEQSTIDTLNEKLASNGFFKNEEALFKKKDGTMFWGLVSCILSRNSEGEVFYDGAIVDIDVQKRTQNRLMAINEELKKTNAELDRFVYSASHDLRAPLKSLLGLLQLAEYEPPQNIQEYLNKMRNSVLKLDYFIEEIIDYSMNARMETNVEQIDFNELIQTVLEKLQYLPAASKIEKKLAINGRHIFYSDRSRCLILLNNLLSNAISYHNPHQANPLILIKVDQQPQQAIITIQDNGKGIDQDHLNNIFKMFYRASAHSNGAGLGLYIVKEILQKLNGSIDVKSSVNQGSAFTLKIPNTPPG